MSREIDGEVVILHLDRGYYFGLDRVGAFIWQRLTKPTALKRVVNAIVAEYKVSPARASRDLLHLIRLLAREKLVDIR